MQSPYNPAARPWTKGHRHGNPYVAVLSTSISLLCWLALAPPASAALTADQIAILVNRSSLESVQVGYYYAKQRGVPETQVIPLDLGRMRETVSRQTYERDIVAPVRRRLEERGLAAKVRVLVTVYGMPLRVLAPHPSEQEQQWRTDAAARQQQAWQALEALARTLQIDVPPPSEATPEAQAPSAEAVKTLLMRINAAVQERVTRVQQGPRQQPDMQELQQLVGRVGGLAAVVQRLRPANPATSRQTRNALEEVKKQIVAAQAMVQVLREVPSDTNRQRAYFLVERIFGLEGILRYAEAEINSFAYADGDASVDSELSLLWWDAPSYRLAGRLANPLHYTFQQLSQRQAPRLPTLMVSRLDAPTPQLAKKMVDHALLAEQQGLQGKVYVDARGLGVPARQLSGYALYDQGLRDMAALFEQVSPYAVTLENTPERFSQPGQAPNVAAYAGWYSYRHYEDAFTFQPGALGYHIASGEAVSIHNPKEAGWCKNALERGITVTLGPTGEPYVDAFPLPQEFFGLLLTGKYSLVEVYYLTTKYVSWRMVLFGDPLYNPWRDKGLAKAKHIALRAAKKGVLPVTLSRLPFPDPIVGRAQVEQRRQAVLAQVEQVMKELARPSEAGEAPRQ